MCWITLPADLKNREFKQKKGFCLTSLQNCLFLVSSEMRKLSFQNITHAASINFVKITINMVHVGFFYLFFYLLFILFYFIFFAIADVKFSVV